MRVKIDNILIYERKGPVMLCGGGRKDGGEKERRRQREKGGAEGGLNSSYGRVL